MDLTGRKVVLGVCGGIAAYKAIEVARRLVDAGAHVTPVMTKSAGRFVGEVTFSALASEPVRSDLFGDRSDPIPHTRLGQDADLILVVPATARLISAYATGYSHDLLTNILLATRAPVMICPAMHTEMWEHPAVQHNLSILADRGVHVVGPSDGKLAGGDTGKGRLVEPEQVVDAVSNLLGGPPGDGMDDVGPANAAADLAGLSVLVTAGGTREPIDPVRFIGNRSSGKQGHAIAERASARGASVCLVTSSSIESSPTIERIQVETAAHVHDAVISRAPSSDVVVMAAAVADFTPVVVSDGKIKKRDGLATVELRPTPDVLAELGSRKSAGQTLVGFAAETDDVRSNAERKLRDKRADLLVVNDVSAPGVGFEFDTNEVFILCANGAEVHVPLTDKESVADEVLDAVVRTRAVPKSTPSGDKA